MENELEKLKRYVFSGHEAVAAQKERISGLKAEGQDTEAAESVLVQLERILVIFKKDLEELRETADSD